MIKFKAVQIKKSTRNRYQLGMIISKKIVAIAVISSWSTLVKRPVVATFSSGERFRYKFSESRRVRLFRPENDFVTSCRSTTDACIGLFCPENDFVTSCRKKRMCWCRTFLVRKIISLQVAGITPVPDEIFFNTIPY